MSVASLRVVWFSEASLIQSQCATSITRRRLAQDVLYQQLVEHRLVSKYLVSCDVEIHRMWRNWFKIQKKLPEKRRVTKNLISSGRKDVQMYLNYVLKMITVE